MSSTLNRDEIMVDDEDVNQLVESGMELVTSILDGSPFEAIKSKVQAGAPLWFQDDDGISALHGAALREDEELVKYLILEGAVWNAVDNLHNTAGDIALSMNNEKCYQIVRDAGIRSELLLTLLSTRKVPSESPLSLVLKATDETPAGSTDAFLSSHLRFIQDDFGQDICLLSAEGEEVGVMMGWERDIMRKTVERLSSGHQNLGRGLRVLNVGFGLGIIDGLFQGLPVKPSQHVIIEPHPDVLKYMRSQGWYEQSGVKILEGKWQDFVGGQELLESGGFDVIYTDTFSEDYQALHAFFEHVPDLLAGPESRFSFFNGLGATNALFYDVYTHVSELHLAEVGIDVEWSDVDVFPENENRWGETREYFTMRNYRLPVGSMRTV